MDTATQEASRARTPGDRGRSASGGDSTGREARAALRVRQPAATPSVRGAQRSRRRPDRANRVRAARLGTCGRPAYGRRRRHEAPDRALHLLAIPDA